MPERKITSPAAAGPAVQPQAPAELYRRLQGSVLVHCHLYLCDKCKRTHLNPSTCFPLTADGICVANYHAFTTTNTLGMAVATRAGRVFPVTEVLAASARDDVVIFRVAAADLQPLPFAAPADVGTPVSVVSHPHSLFYVMTQGTVARYCLDKGARRMQITADYAIGSSGGPVLNAGGGVVGMVASTQTIYADRHHGEPGNLQMVVKLCVPSASIRQLIKEE
jgi:S1-C subfamily serine protease